MERSRAVAWGRTKLGTRQVEGGAQARRAPGKRLTWVLRRHAEKPPQEVGVSLEGWGSSLEIRIEKLERGQDDAGVCFV